MDRRPFPARFLPTGSRVPPQLYAVTGTCLLLLIGCQPPSKPATKAAAAPPAKVEKLAQETEIARITLSPKAEQRLGITLTSFAMQQVQRRRTFGGEATIPGGRTIIVSAPVAGAIGPPAQGQIPLPGESIQAGQAVLSLVPLLTPERDVPTPAERVQMANARATLLSALTVAKGDVARSQAEVDAAKIALNRAEQLLADQAGTARAVDDARGQWNIVTSSLTAAKEREEQLDALLTELDSPAGEAAKATPLTLHSPQSGVIRNLAVSRGQTVNAGAPLFEVLDTRTIWIRVPLYVDLLTEVDTTAAALVKPLGQRGRRAAFSAATEDAAAATLPPQTTAAQPITAPPTADPLSGTADLYYEADNASLHLRPGQRVGVEIPLQGAGEALVVSAKAILYDIYGGAWVYIKSGEHAYQRERVLIRYTAGGLAVLDQGPAPGVEAVVDGAAELYGAEFGAGK
ncbi:efflux RND transporter periplasmic adaptor subunit [Lignipirellula cremea]|uniref:Putative efflux pump membrane fusion protein n=1 Tax=Lignipirellula cremea TaxID=2528010 RepID=A0A518E3N7_9BACT|nr:efflux RND transporter periplasmic adaptor subunit [Lignipirellula cremea]QDU98697.1 putative efflux pump membrane fusion protein [Lignipirellula cremea]